MRGSRAVALVDDIRVGLQTVADPAYVEGTVEARNPSKPVLGIRIPLLRAAVKTALKASPLALPPRRSSPPQLPPPGDVADLLTAADELWKGRFHEEELAACMLVRLAGPVATVPIPAGLVREWAPLLDNWLSVDELGGVLGPLVAADLPGVAATVCATEGTALGAELMAELRFLAASDSPWQRRLYVVCLITPLRLGLDPATVPDLLNVFADARKPVRMASLWLLRDVLKRRPAAGEQFRAIWPLDAPSALTRILATASTTRAEGVG